MQNQESPTVPSVRYPEIEVRLAGTDSNAFAILGAVSKALRAGGVSGSEVTEFFDDASDGDYDHLLQTCFRWVSVR